MNSRQNPLLWSVHVGTIFGIRIRVSWFFPVLLLWLGWEFGMRMGIALWTILFFSILLHEIGHVLAARAMDGSGDDILIWPLGGLAYVESSNSPRTQFVTTLGGPLVNFLLCGLFLPAVLHSEYSIRAWDPRAIPIPPDEFGVGHLASDLQVLTFSMNWILLLLNLIPACPLDGGQMLRSVFNARLGPPTSIEASIRVSVIVGVIVLLSAMLFLKSYILVGIAFFVILHAVLESHQLQSGEGGEESFLGYDFSQGYTSLEKSEQVRTTERKAGVLERWRERRRQEKLRRLQEQEAEVDQQLDAILEKVHNQGMDALTPAEKRLLKRASERFRGKGND